MKFGVLILPGTCFIDDLIYVFMQVMGHKVVNLVFKDHGLPDADFIVNSVNA